MKVNGTAVKENIRLQKGSDQVIRSTAVLLRILRDFGLKNNGEPRAEKTKANIWLGRPA